MPRTPLIYKLSKALSAEQLKALLAEFYPRFPARITPVSVVPVPPPPNNQSSAIKMYKQAFGKNQSAHHSSLKWFGLHWCLGGSSEFQKFRYEAQIAYPTQLELALLTPGKGEVVGEGVILPPRHQSFFNDCVLKVADVFGCGNIVECGVTDLSSLALPLAARVANRVLWLPYPNKDTYDECDDFAKPIDALLIERQPLPAAVGKADHYPLRVLKKGEHMVLLGDRDSRGKMSSDGNVTVTYYNRVRFPRAPDVRKSRARP